MHYFPSCSPVQCISVPSGRLSEIFPRHVPQRRIGTKTALDLTWEMLLCWSNVQFYFARSLVYGAQVFSSSQILEFRNWIHGSVKHPKDQLNPENTATATNQPKPKGSANGRHEPVTPLCQLCLEPMMEGWPMKMINLFGCFRLLNPTLLTRSNTKNTLRKPFHAGKWTIEIGEFPIYIETSIQFREFPLPCLITRGYPYFRKPLDLDPHCKGPKWWGKIG